MQTVVRYKTEDTGQLTREMQAMIERGFKVVTMAMHVGGEANHNFPRPVEAVVVFEPEIRDYKRNFEIEKLEEEYRKVQEQAEEALEKHKGNLHIKSLDFE